MVNLSNFLWPVYRKYLQIRLQQKAKSTDKVFACNALHGNSSYNISIHSDMTVSCNCQDFDGSGYIGNLNENTFQEIFTGEIAQGFRRNLSERKYPLALCCTCPELLLVDKTNAGTYLCNYQLPHKGIMVENTVLCNYSCRLCKRKELLKVRKEKVLPQGGIEKIAKIIKGNKIEVVAFYNLGEPFLSRNVAHEISVLRNSNKNLKIVTSTNGVPLDSYEKMQSALLIDHILFSIDGTNQQELTHYQKGGDFDRAYSNMKKLVLMRDEECVVNTIEWRYVLFRGNDKPTQIKRAIELAKQAKVDIISFIPGTAEFYNRSFLYHWHPFYKHLGTKCKLWEGREIDYRGLRKVKAWSVQDLDS